MNKERLNFLLQGLAAGRLNRSDYDELIAFMHQEQSEAPLLEGMDSVWQELEALYPGAGEPDEALYRNIVANPAFRPAGKPPVKLRPGIRRYVPAVAASVLLVAAGLGLFRLLSSGNNKQGAANSIEMTVSTITGERREIVLPDSSHVWLNAGSRLHYPPRFAAGSRELALEGEAYFDVQKDPRRPFIVHTGKVSTTVLGTAFDINTYDSSVLSVTVTRGKVRVAIPGRELALLIPDKQLQYRPSDGSAATLDVAGNDLSAWRNGDLVFSNASMEEAAAVMGRWFGTRFQFKDPAIRQYRFSVAFRKGETLHEAMDVIGALNNFAWRASGDTIVVFINH